MLPQNKEIKNFSTLTDHGDKTPPKAKQSKYAYGKPTSPNVNSLEVPTLNKKEVLQLIEKLKISKCPNCGNHEIQVHTDRFFIVNTRRTSGQNDPGRSQGSYFVEPDLIGMDLAVNLTLPHPPSNQLGILGPKIENQYPVKTNLSLHLISLRIQRLEENGETGS